MQKRAMNIDDIDDDEELMRDIFEYFTGNEQKQYGCIVLSLLSRKPEE